MRSAGTHCLLVALTYRNAAILAQEKTAYLDPSQLVDDAGVIRRLHAPAYELVERGAAWRDARWDYGISRPNLLIWTSEAASPTQKHRR